MPSLKLDARFPLVVVVGQFNPAIFSISWMARHLYGYAPGTEVSVTEIVAENPGRILSLNFIDGVAMLVSDDRLEIFTLDQEEATLAMAEKVLVAFGETLPHTPVRAVGCNFHYVSEAPPAALVDLFSSPEGLEGEYSIRGSSTSFQIECEHGVLNFSRSLGAERVRFNFNYHRADAETGQLAQMVPGMVQGNRDHSVALLSSLYGFNEYEPFTFTMGGGVATDGAANASDIAEEEAS